MAVLKTSAAGVGNNQMEDMTLIVWGMLFGIIGFSFFIYGKKQQAIVPLITGVALCVFPYFISNVYILVIVGCALTVTPYFVRL